MDLFNRTKATVCGGIEGHASPISKRKDYFFLLGVGGENPHENEGEDKVAGYGGTSPVYVISDVPLGVYTVHMT